MAAIATTSKPARDRQYAITPGRAVLMALVWLGGLLFIFPLVWTLISSFRPGQSFLVSPFVFNPSELTLNNYHVVFSNDSFLIGFKNTFIQVVLVLATTLFFAPLAAYGFSKFQFPGRRFLFGVMMLTLFFVPLTQYIPLLIEMNQIGWVDTYQGLIAPLAISSFSIFWMTGVVSSIPDDLLAAARVDGAGNFAIFWRVVMPVIRPALVSLAVVTFLAAYNDYFWPLLILPSSSMQTIQISLSALATTVSTNSYTSTGAWGPVLAASAVVFLPTIIVFMLMQRYFVQGVLQGSLKE